MNDQEENLFDDEFRNSMEIIIAEFIGSIPKNYSNEYQRLTGYTFYPSLNPKQFRTLTIENITSKDIKSRISDKVYKQLEFIFEKKITNWNSIVQTTAKRFVTNAVEQAIDSMREKFLEDIDQEKQTPYVIVQRFILVDNHLKIV